MLLSLPSVCTFKYFHLFPLFFRAFSAQIHLSFCRSSFLLPHNYIYLIVSSFILLSILLLPALLYLCKPFFCLSACILFRFFSFYYSHLIHSVTEMSVFMFSYIYSEFPFSVRFKLISAPGLYKTLFLLFCPYIFVSPKEPPNFLFVLLDTTRLAHVVLSKDVPCIRISLCGGYYFSCLAYLNSSFSS